MNGEPEYVPDFPVAQLVHHPKNARHGNVAMIAESLREHGQYKPLVVQRRADDGTEYVVCAGNHTMDALIINLTAVSRVLLVDVNDDEALRILIIDNRSNDVADYDDRELAALLQVLSESERGFAGTGFGDSDLKDLLNMLEPPGLDALSREHGEHDPESTWPVLRFKVSPETRDRYLRLVQGRSGSDADLFAFVLALAETAPVPA